MPKYNTQAASRRNGPNSQLAFATLPDKLTITTLFTIREEENAKTQWAISFRQGHAGGAYSSNCFLKRFFFLVNKVQRRLLDMNRDEF